MERLTDKDEYGYYAPRDVTLNCLKHRGKLVDRLAAYEDTELEPEEIKAKLDGLDEFQKLEAEGRLVVLPCKVGDVLWDTESLTESPSRHIVLGFDVLKSLNMVHLSGGQSLPVSEIGKTVFLSREEAEEALGKEGTSDGV